MILATPGTTTVVAEEEEEEEEAEADGTMITAAGETGTTIVVVMVGIMTEATGTGIGVIGTEDEMVGTAEIMTGGIMGGDIEQSEWLKCFLALEAVLLSSCHSTVYVYVHLFCKFYYYCVGTMPYS